MMRSTVVQGLTSLADHLAPELGCELLRLVDADSRANQVADLEQRTQRAEDLANEAKRQLRVRDRQVDELRHDLGRLS